MQNLTISMLMGNLWRLELKATVHKTQQILAVYVGYENLATNVRMKIWGKLIATGMLQGGCAFQENLWRTVRQSRNC